MRCNNGLQLHAPVARQNRPLDRRTIHQGLPIRDVKRPDSKLQGSIIQIGSVKLAKAGFEMSDQWGRAER